MRPLVSVLIVTYNHRPFIRDCLDSVLSQEGGFELEIIVTDDCSTDGSAQIINDYSKKYPDVLQAILRPKNVGGNINFWDAIVKCTGEFIAYLDGDDLMLPGKIQAQLDVMHENPDCAIVAHNMLVFEEGNESRTRLFNKKPPATKRDINDIVRFGAKVCNSSTMFRSLCLESDAPIIPLQATGDWLFHLKNARFGDLYFIDQVLGKYRRHEGSAVRRHIRNIDLVLCDFVKTLEIAGTYKCVHEEAIRDGYARVYMQRALRYLEYNRSDKFRELMKLSRQSSRIGTRQTLLFALSRARYGAYFLFRIYRRFVKAMT